MERLRQRRASKVVNYAALSGEGSDDEDFVEFTPPTKKKKEIRKEATILNNKENEAIYANNKENMKEESPKQRLSVKERKFQREVAMAVQLSTKETSQLVEKEVGFSGFNGRSEEITDNVLFSPKPELLTVEKASPKNSTMCVTAVSTEIQDGESKLSGEKKHSNYSASMEEEPVPSTSSGFTAKRIRKKVNFVEDDDSDDWAGDAVSCKDDSSSDSEDFCPSNKRKGAKCTKTTKKQPTKRESRASVRKPSTSKEETDNLPKRKLTSPILPSLVLSIKKCSDEVVTLSNSSVRNFLTTPTAGEAKSVAVNSGLNSLHTSSATCNKGSKTSAVLDKASIKTPTVRGPTSNSSTSPNSPSVKIGLRLGLSRRGNFKPLHPNISIR